MKRIVQTLICLFRPDCSVFKGDDFVDLLKAQTHASMQGARHLRSLREQPGPIEDAMFPPGSRKGDRS